MSKSERMYYSETFKLEVLRDYYSSGLSKYFISKKWNLKSLSYLPHWIKCYPIDSEVLSLPESTIKKLQMKQEEKSREELLQEEVLNLRRALEMEKLRSRAFEKLIEITEEKEGISILKKAGAKQWQVSAKSIRMKIWILFAACLARVVRPIIRIRNRWFHLP
ncbi:MAG: hypothetical protein LBN06_03540 [Prevotellaceae bacterium]|jgi:transposase-like protein|nr:hypothetical protein [Prevotellaceae bacterium]